MKKLLIALAICLVVVVAMGGPVLGAAQKVLLYRIGADTGEGFVIFNDTSGTNNVQLEMSLKGADPEATYDVIVHMNGADTDIGMTITTNKEGNANFHYSWTEDGSGMRQLGFALEQGGTFMFGVGPVDHFFKE